MKTQSKKPYITRKKASLFTVFDKNCTSENVVCYIQHKGSRLR